MNELLVVLLIPALVSGSLLDELRTEAQHYPLEDIYQNELKNGIVREKIVRAIARNRTCTTLYELEDYRPPSADQLLDLLREAYPAPFNIEVVSDQVEICWPKFSPDLSREIGMLIVFFAVLIYLFSR